MLELPVREICRDEKVILRSLVFLFLFCLFGWLGLSFFLSSLLFPEIKSQSQALSLMQMTQWQMKAKSLNSANEKQEESLEWKDSC